MRDLAEASWLRARQAEDRLRHYFLLHGYRVLAPPILEYTELFLRKSGGQLASRMYTLTDPGGNLVSMRPEFTCSIMRHLVEDGYAPPERLQYCGAVFRYDPVTHSEGPESGLRQFTQVGAELLGIGGPTADAEGLALAQGALSALGVGDVRLTLGDVSVHRVLLEACGLSDRAITFVLESVHELEGGPDGLEQAWQQAEKVGLLILDDRSYRLPAFINELEGPDARELLRRLLDLTGADEGSLGQRSSDEMLDRLLRKAQPVDDPAHFKKGMEAAASLAAIKGNPTQALAEARALLQDYKAGPGHLDGLARSLELLDDLDRRDGSIRLDFGLARELAYYTGIIFEVTMGGNGASLGGGGRYDGLARALGSPSDLPALGFAYSLEAVLEQIGASDDKNSPDEATRYIWPTGDLAYRKALALASEMRAHGHPAVVEVCPRDLQGAIVFARSQGYSSVLAVDVDGTTTTYPAG